MTLSAEELAKLIEERDELVKKVLKNDSANPDQNQSSQDFTITDENVEKALTLAKKSRAERIKSLSKYNDIKDIAQNLIGMIADQRGSRVIDIMNEMDIENDD